MFLSISPFYTFTRSSYKIKGEEDNVYYVSSNLHYQQNNDLLYHQFGLGSALNLDQNLIQLIATFKTGNTKTNFNGETEDYQEYSNSAFEVDDSSYWYYFHYSYDFENEVANHNELKRISEVRLDLRWQK